MVVAVPCSPLAPTIWRRIGFGREPLIFEGQYVFSAAFSPDGKLGAHSQFGRLRDALECRLRPMPGHVEKPWDLCFDSGLCFGLEIAAAADAWAR